MESIKSMASAFNVYNLKSPQRHFFPPSCLEIRHKVRVVPDQVKAIIMVLLVDKPTSELSFEHLSVKLCFISEGYKLTAFCRAFSVKIYMQAPQNLNCYQTEDQGERLKKKKTVSLFFTHSPDRPSFKSPYILWILHLGFPTIWSQMRHDPKQQVPLIKAGVCAASRGAWGSGQTSPLRRTVSTANLFSMRLYFWVLLPTPPNTF